MKDTSRSSQISAAPDLYDALAEDVPGHQGQEEGGEHQGRLGVVLDTGDDDLSVKADPGGHDDQAVPGEVDEDCEHSRDDDYVTEKLQPLVSLNIYIPSE